MMRHKEKEQVEEGNLFAKMTWKQTHVEAKEIQTML
jgi:hypothetical protein